MWHLPWVLVSMCVVVFGSQKWSCLHVITDLQSPPLIDVSELRACGREFKACQFQLLTEFTLSQFLLTDLKVSTNLNFIYYLFMHLLTASLINKHCF